MPASLWLWGALAVALILAWELQGLKGYQTLWQVGEFDGSPAEFALAPDGARRFTEVFPQDPVFVVGESSPSQWPFIHPNEADTAWGGAPHHSFRLRFFLDRRPTGRWALLVALSDAHERLAPEMLVYVNGHEHRRKLRPGAGRAFFGDLAHGQPQTVWVAFDADQLQAGENEIVLTLRGGSWVAYDALALLRRAGALTAGRRPSFRPHAFTAQAGPLHPDFPALPAWDSSLLALEGQTGWFYLLGTAGQRASPPVELANEHFVVSFDLRPVQGTMALEYALPHAAQPCWRLQWTAEEIWLDGGERRVRPGPGTWHVEITNGPDTVALRVRRVEGGEEWEGGCLAHAWSPPARLWFVALSSPAQAYLTNVSWTAPLRLRAQAGRHAGRPCVAITLSTPAAHDEASATLTLTGPRGETLARRVSRWGEGQEVLAVRVPLPALGPLPTRVSCELRQPGRRGPILAASCAVRPMAKRAAAPPARPPGAYVVETEAGTIIGNQAYEMLLLRAASYGLSRLVDRRSGAVLADRPYSYALGDGGEAPVLERHVHHGEKGALTVTLRAAAGPVTVHHLLVVPPDEPSFAERFAVEISPTAPAPLDIRSLRCGWVRTAPGPEDEENCQATLIPVPWRRDTWGAAELLDLSLSQAFWQQGWYRPSGAPDKTWLPQHGSEAWLWHTKGGGTLIAKINEEFMEWSLIDRLTRDGELLLRFGGCGAWHGDPQSWERLAPGQTVTTGWTYYLQYQGDPTEGFYAFRELMARHGHRCPFDFDPPVHWNELYDNPLWWGPDTPERRQKYYRLPDMLVEAEKARQAGCQALYLDPGWDTVFGSHLWDETRLGPLAEFVRRMHREYGLKIALHTPLADWASAGGGGATYPPQAWRVDENGQVLPGRLCSGAQAYLQEEARRLNALAAAGVAYFMFDGSAYTGPCFSRAHGHPVPYTRDAHIQALKRLAQMVHAEHPQVLIEQHDQIVAGVHSVYTPVYLGHGNGGWDERWANEYMWSPLQDLKEYRARSLYYYNLAYHLPLYVHIDLRDDNEHGLAFWWYASTCRHLGLGGTHPDGRHWLTVQRHMRQYLAYQDYFKRGVFYGWGEEIHAHVLPERGALIVVFNLSDQPQKKRFFANLARMGLATRGRLYLRGGTHVRLGEGVEIQVEVPAWGVRLLELRTAGSSGGWRLASR
jgi:hypothetical protein